MLTVIPLYIGYCMGPHLTRRVLEERAQHLFQNGVDLERARITIFGGFGIELRNLRIPRNDGQDFLTAGTVLLKPSVKSLFLGHIQWRSVVLREPSIQLIRTTRGDIRGPWKKTATAGQGDGAIFDDLRDLVGCLPAHLSVHQGRFRFVDQSGPGDGFVTEIQEIEMTSRTTSSGEHFSFAARGHITPGGDEKFSISGRVAGIQRFFEPGQQDAEISVRARDIESRWLSPYIKGTLPFEDMGGVLDLTLSVKGRLTSFRSSGEIKVRDGCFTIPKLYTHAIQPPEVSLGFDLEYGRENVHINQITVKAPHLSLRGRGILQGHGPGNRVLSLTLASEKTRFDDAIVYLPDKQLPDGIASFLTEPGIKGSFCIEQAIFEGPLTVFTGEGMRENSHVFSVQTRLENVAFLTDSGFPPFHNISGLLVLQGNRLNINGLHGQLRGLGSVDLGGSISQIDSDPIMALTVTGDLNLANLPTLAGTHWVPGDVRKGIVRIAKISGKASFEGQIRHRFRRPSELDYRGLISLKRVHLKMPGLPGPLTHGTGEIRFDKKEVLLPHFQCRIGKNTLHAKAAIRHYLRKHSKRMSLSDKLKISFELSAEKMCLEDFLPPAGGKRAARTGPEHPWLNMTILGKVRVGDACFKDVRLHNVNTSFVAHRGLLRFRHFHAEAPAGFVACNGWLNLTNHQSVTFKLTPRIHHLDLASVIRFIRAPARGDLLSGTVNLEGIVAGGGRSINEILGSLTGDLRFDVVDGIIYGIRGHGKGDLPFREARGRILIEHGVASTTDLHLASDVMTMVIRGIADMNKGSLDILIGVRPLQTVDKILSNVPVAGWLLAGKDKSILTFPYRVKGPFNDLKVEDGLDQTRNATTR